MPDYYLYPATVGLPQGLPELKHNYQADGRHVFQGETDQVIIWIQPKPQAWNLPNLWGSEKPPMDAGHLPPKPTTPDAGHIVGAPAMNYGVNINGLKPHENRVETNDPGFFPALQNNAATGQEVPLPLGGDGPPASMPPYVLYGVVVALVLAALFVPWGHRRSSLNDE